MVKGASGGEGVQGEQWFPGGMFVLGSWGWSERGQLRERQLEGGTKARPRRVCWSFGGVWIPPWGSMKPLRRFKGAVMSSNFSLVLPLTTV